MNINLRYIIGAVYRFIAARRGVNPHGYLNSTPMNGAAKHLNQPSPVFSNANIKSFPSL
jgi:hypothetical protein